MTTMKTTEALERVNAYDFNSPWYVSAQIDGTFHLVDNEAQTEFGGAEVVGVYATMDDAAKALRDRVNEFRSRRNYYRYAPILGAAK